MLAKRAKLILQVLVAKVDEASFLALECVAHGEFAAASVAVLGEVVWCETIPKAEVVLELLLAEDGPVVVGRARRQEGAGFASVKQAALSQALTLGEEVLVGGRECSVSGRAGSDAFGKVNGLAAFHR